MILGTSRGSRVAARRQRRVLTTAQAWQTNGEASHTGGAVATAYNAPQTAPGAKQQAPDFSTYRKALPEVVMGSGRAPEQIAARILEVAEKQRTVLAIRIEPETYAAVRKHAPGVKYNMRAKTLTYSSDSAHELPKAERLAGTVALVAANESELQVAEEARAVAEALGCYVFRIADSHGSAVQNILHNMQAIQSADVVIVITGADMSVSNVVAELVDSPVISVPTTTSSSSGLAGLAGLAPMLTTMSATTPGVSVVGMDNGYAAGVSAARVLASATRLHKIRSTAEAAARAAAEAAAAIEALTNGTSAHSNGNGLGNGLSNGNAYMNGNGNGKLYLNGNGNGNGVHVNGTALPVNGNSVMVGMQ